MQIALDDALLLAERLLRADGAPDDIAADVARHLVESDRVGYASHGLSILPTYHRSVATGLLHPGARLEILRDDGTRLACHGHHGYGQHIGKHATALAIERARTHGLCMLTLRSSHHLGRMGHYGEMAAAAGQLLIAFTNVVNREPLVAPYGGAQARLTTNPICFAGPLPDGRPPFVVDMATSAIAVNRARVLAQSGQDAPPGALIDAEGHPSRDPAVLFGDPPGALLPFGGHKGYALGLVAELLAGVLSGGGTIQPAHPRHGAPTNNLFALLIDPKQHLDVDFLAGETGAFIDYLLSCPPAAGSEGVQYPGQFEAANRARHLHHIELDDALYASLRQLAAEQGIRPGDLPS